MVLANVVFLSNETFSNDVPTVAMSKTFGTFCFLIKVETKSTTSGPSKIEQLVQVPELNYVRLLNSLLKKHELTNKYGSIPVDAFA